MNDGIDKFGVEQGLDPLLHVSHIQCICLPAWNSLTCVNWGTEPLLQIMQNGIGIYSPTHPIDCYYGTWSWEALYYHRVHSCRGNEY